MADFIEEYNKLSKLTEESRQKMQQARIAFNEKLDEIADYYEAHAGELHPDPASVKAKVYSDGEVYKNLYWTNLDVDNNPELQQSMVEDNDDRNWQMRNLRVRWDKFTELDSFILDWWNTVNQTDVYEEELKELVAGTKEEEKPEPDASQEIANIQEQTQMEVKEVTTTPDPEGHTYPVATVKGWTNELKGYNNQLTKFIAMFKSINFDKVDRMWLKKQVLKFINWLKDKLDKLKKKVVSGLKGMMQPVKKAMGLLSPILSLPSDPLAILGWAGNVVSFFTEPYTKVMQFISDFTTYTPPLIGEATKLAVGVATIPIEINQKAQELSGEGAEVIKEEIANAVAGVAFEPPSMGDLT